MKEFGGYLFSDTNEIDGLLLDALSEGDFDSFLEQHTFEKKVLMQQIAQSQKDGGSVIQEICTLGTEEIGLCEVEGLSDAERDYLCPYPFLDCGAGGTITGNLFFVSIESADRVAQPTRDNDKDRMLYAVGLLYRAMDERTHCIMKSFLK